MDPQNANKNAPVGQKGPWTTAGVRIEAGRIFRVDLPAPIGRHTAVVTHVKDHNYVEVIYGRSDSGTQDQHTVVYGDPEAKPFGSWIRHDTYFRIENVVIIEASIIGDYVGKALANRTQVRLEVIARAARNSGKVRDLRPSSALPQATATTPSPT